MNSPTKEIEFVIKPNQSWLDLELDGFLHYRDLLFLLVRRDFVAKFKQTILGPAWLILQPLFATIVGTLIFGVVAGIASDGVPYFLFYLCGQLGWNYFSHTYASSSGTLQLNSTIFSKVYFPRLIPPVSVCLSNLFAYIVQTMVFIFFWCYFKQNQVSGFEPYPWQGVICYTQAYYQFNFTPWLAMLPLVICQTALLAMGLGFLMSALTVKYRDFSQIGGFIMQFMMYCTPIIFPLSLLLSKIKEHAPGWEWIVHLNPLAYIIEMYRLMFLGKATIPPMLPFSSWGITIILFLVGLMVFNKIQRTYIDYL